MTREEAAHVAYQIPGWAWPAELGWLWSAFAASRSHLEVGVFCGKSLWMAAAAMGQDGGGRKSVVAVDPLGSTACGRRWEAAVLAATLAEIRERAGVKVTWWKRDSVAAVHVAYERGLTFDSIYLDADHNYAETRGAIESWLPFVQPGGLLAGHDYCPSDLGVMDAVNECLAGRFSVAPGTRIWCTRV